MPPVLHKKKREKKRRLDNAVAGTSEIRTFFVTRAKTKLPRAIQKIPNAMRLTLYHRYQRLKTKQRWNQRLKPKQRRNQQRRNPARAEPTRRGPVVQLVRPDAQQPDGSRSLSTGHIANRNENDNYSSRFMPPKRTVCYQQREWQHTHFLGKTLQCTFWGNGTFN